MRLVSILHPYVTPDMAEKLNTEVTFFCSDTLFVMVGKIYFLFKLVVGINIEKLIRHVYSKETSADVPGQI